jgi:hypothetical protein
VLLPRIDELDPGVLEVAGIMSGQDGAELAANRRDVSICAADRASGPLSR